MAHMNKENSSSALLAKLKELHDQFESNGDNQSIVGKIFLSSYPEITKAIPSQSSSSDNVPVVLKVLLTVVALFASRLDPTSDTYCRDQAVLAALIGILSVVIDIFCIQGAICDALKDLYTNVATALANLERDDPRYCIKQAIRSAEIGILSLLIDLFCCL